VLIQKTQEHNPENIKEVREYIKEQDERDERKTRQLTVIDLRLPDAHHVACAVVAVPKQ